MRTIDRPSPVLRRTDAADPIPPAFAFPRPLSGARSESGVLRTVVLDVRGGGPDAVLADALAERGIRVLRLLDLLGDVLTDQHVLRALAERVAALEASSPATRARIVATLTDAAGAEAAWMILRGIPATDRDRDPRSPDRAQYLALPLSASRSLRQPLVAAGVRPFAALLPGREARRAIAVHGVIAAAHPAFAEMRPRRYRPDPELPRHDAGVDGDDVQTAPDGSVVVGVGRHSNLRGARQLALSLLAEPGVPRVLAVSMKPAPVDRLDQLVGFLDRRTALVHPALLSDDAVTWELRMGEDPSGPALVAVAPRPFRDHLPRMLDERPVVHRVPAGGHGPQHFLVTGPGGVLTASPVGDPTSLLLHRAGVDVSGLPGEHEPEQVIRSGGLRRVVLPVERDALEPGPTALDRSAARRDAAADHLRGVPADALEEPS
ncbi:MAG TPA: arginine deiminase family protein [Amnibacterium sp.]|jgi:hypothetical protein|uniref:arginine deiminase family protein n=1 Tax=Amnibacterium sp. TaxID=1872496 RepID=UPI002F95C9EC